MKPTPFSIRDDRLLTKREVAQHLGMSLRNIDRLVARGHLKRLRIGAGTVRFLESDLNRLITQASQ